MLLTGLSDLPHSDPEGLRLEAQNCGWHDGVRNGTSGKPWTGFRRSLPDT